MISFISLLSTMSESESEFTIFDAIEDGNIEDIKRLIGEGSNPVGTLEYAYDNKKMYAMKLLVEAGYKVDPMDDPLILQVIRDGNVEALEILLGGETGANIEEQDPYGYTPLHVASMGMREKSYECARILLKNGANIEHRHKYSNMNPLHSASLADSFDTVELLLGKGADIEAKDNEDCTPLHYMSGFRTTKLLLEKGANIEAKNDEGKTPLHIIIEKWPQQGYGLEMIQLLLENGANVEARDGNGIKANQYHYCNKKVTKLFEAFFEKNEKATTIQCFLRTMMAKNVSNKRRVEPDQLFDPDFSTRRKKLLKIDDSLFR